MRSYMRSDYRPLICSLSSLESIDSLSREFLAYVYFTER